MSALRVRSWVRGLPMRVWRTVRALTGDDAYERYLEHVRRAHAGTAPLDAARFHRELEEHRFSGGPTRCC